LKHKIKFKLLGNPGNQNPYRPANPYPPQQGKQINSLIKVIKNNVQQKNFPIDISITNFDRHYTVSKQE